METAAVEADVVPTGPADATPAATLVVVDDEPAITEILDRRLTLDGYRVETASSAAEARSRIATGRPSVLLADIQMPGENGLELLTWARRHDPDLAVIMITAAGTVGSAVEALRAGARDYLLKPFDLDQVSFAVARALAHRRLVVENRAYREELEAMVDEKTRAHADALAEIQVTYDATLQALGAALSYRNGASPGRSRSVAALSVAIARRMALPPAEIAVIERAALLRNIGKMAVPDAALGEEDGHPLLRGHPRKGYELLSRIAFLRPAADIVHAQQERYDGSGYPRGLAGEAIPLGARILAVASAYDAAAAGCRGPGSGDAAARAALRAGSGTRFDPRVVEALLALGHEAVGTA